MKTAEEKNNQESKHTPELEALRKEFDDSRCSIYTTVSSAPVLRDFMWFVSKITPLKEQLSSLQEENALLKIRVKTQGAGLNNSQKENQRLKEALEAVKNWTEIARSGSNWPYPEELVNSALNPPLP